MDIIKNALQNLINYSGIEIIFNPKYIYTCWVMKCNNAYFVIDNFKHILAENCSLESVMNAIKQEYVESKIAFIPDLRIKQIDFTDAKFKDLYYFGTTYHKEVVS